MAVHFFTGKDAVQQFEEYVRTHENNTISSFTKVKTKHMETPGKNYLFFTRKIVFLRTDYLHHVERTVSSLRIIADAVQS